MKVVRVVPKSKLTPAERPKYESRRAVTRMDYSLTFAILAVEELAKTRNISFEDAADIWFSVCTSCRRLWQKGQPIGFPGFGTLYLRPRYVSKAFGKRVDHRIFIPEFHVWHRMVRVFRRDTPFRGTIREQFFQVAKVEWRRFPADLRRLLNGYQKFVGMSEEVPRAQYPKKFQGNRDVLVPTGRGRSRRDSDRVPKTRPVQS